MMVHVHSGIFRLRKITRSNFQTLLDYMNIYAISLLDIANYNDLRTDNG